MAFKCMECEGSGYCMACGGRGIVRLNNYASRYVECDECLGARTCMYCHGEGFFEDSGDDDEDEAA